MAVRDCRRPGHAQRPRGTGARTGSRTQPDRTTSTKPAKTPKTPKGKGIPRKLVVTAGGLAGTRIGLGDQPITIGRADDSTLVLTDDYASTRHARLMPQDGQWFVEDLGSTNGTYLDRDKVTGPTPVPLGVP